MKIQDIKRLRDEATADLADVDIALKAEELSGIMDYTMEQANAWSAMQKHVRELPSIATFAIEQDEEMRRLRNQVEVATGAWENVTERMKGAEEKLEAIKKILDRGYMDVPATAEGHATHMAKKLDEIRAALYAGLELL